MWRRVVQIVGYCVLICATLETCVLERHVLRGHGPSVSYGLYSRNCTAYVEALWIATEVAGHFDYQGQFGLPEGINAVRPYQCDQEDWRLPPLDWDYWQGAADVLRDRLTERPANHFPLLIRETGLVANVAEPFGPMAHLRSVVEHSPALSSGQGWRHYLRCDYSLRREPFWTFYAADLRLRTELREEEAQRFEECGLAAALAAHAEDVLREASILPVQYREKK